MHTEIRAYHAMTSRDILARVALQRASIMHLVDLKRGGTPRVVQNCGSTVSPIGRSPAEGKGRPGHPFDGKDIWKTPAEGQPSPNEDVLINLEALPGRHPQRRLEACEGCASARQDAAL